MRILYIAPFLSCISPTLVNTKYLDYKFDPGSKEIPSDFDQGSIPVLFKLFRENWQSTIEKYRGSNDEYDSQEHIIQEASSNARMVIKNANNIPAGTTLKEWTEIALKNRRLMIAPLQWYENLWHFIEKASAKEVEDVIAVMQDSHYQPLESNSFIINIGRGAIRSQELYWLHIHSDQSASQAAGGYREECSAQVVVEKRNANLLGAEHACYSFTYKLNADQKLNHEVLKDFMKQFTDYCRKNFKSQDIYNVCVEINRDLTEIRVLYPNNYYSYPSRAFVCVLALCVLSGLILILYKKRISAYKGSYFNG